jgi:hypothetical protein
MAPPRVSALELGGGSWAAGSYLLNVVRRMQGAGARSKERISRGAWGVLAGCGAAIDTLPEWQGARWLVLGSKQPVRMHGSVWGFVCLGYDVRHAVGFGAAVAGWVWVASQASHRQVD